MKCCDRCLQINNCITKWVRGEEAISVCCDECPSIRLPKTEIEKRQQDNYSLRCHSEVKPKIRFNIFVLNY